MNNEIIDAFFERDRETEELLWSGEELEDGMVVLSYHRDIIVDVQSADPQFYKETLAEALVANRWCEVRELRIVDDSVRFTAFYADGSEVERVLHVGYPWLVQRKHVLKKKRERLQKKLCSLINDAMKEQDNFSQGPLPGIDEDTALDTSYKILALFEKE